MRDKTKFDETIAGAAMSATYSGEKSENAEKQRDKQFRFQLGLGEASESKKQKKVDTEELKKVGGPQFTEKSSEHPLNILYSSSIKDSQANETFVRVAQAFELTNPANSGEITGIVQEVEINIYDERKNDVTVNVFGEHPGYSLKYREFFRVNPKQRKPSLGGEKNLDVFSVNISMFKIKEFTGTYVQKGKAWGVSGRDAENPKMWQKEAVKNAGYLPSIDGGEKEIEKYNPTDTVEMVVNIVEGKVKSAHYIKEGSKTDITVVRDKS